MTKEISIITPEHVEVKFEFAGIGSRFLAILLDSLIQSGILLVIGLIFFFGLYTSSNYNINTVSPWIIAITALLVFSLWSGYFLFFEATRNGQTPGKKAIGIRVIRDTGHPVDFRSAFLRNVLRLVDYLPGTYAIGIISIFISPQYRRLGDYVGGTFVVRTGLQHEVKRSSAAVQIAPVPAQESAASISTAQTSDLPQEALPFMNNITRDDYRAVRHFLDRRNELDAGLAKNLAKKLADPIAGKIHLNPADISDPITFLESIRREWEYRMIH